MSVDNQSRVVFVAAIIASCSFTGIFVAGHVDKRWKHELRADLSKACYRQLTENDFTIGDDREMTNGQPTNPGGQ